MPVLVRQLRSLPLSKMVVTELLLHLGEEVVVSWCQIKKDKY